MWDLLGPGIEPMSSLHWQAGSYPLYHQEYHLSGFKWAFLLWWMKLGIFSKVLGQFHFFFSTLYIFCLRFPILEDWLLVFYSSWILGTLYILAVCNIGCKIPPPTLPVCQLFFNFVLPCLCFFGPRCPICGILVLWPVMQLGPWQWKHWALTSQLPGYSLLWLYTFIWLCLVAAYKLLVVTCGISFPAQGLNLGPPALGGWSLSHQTTREVPRVGGFILFPTLLGKKVSIK